MRDARVVLGIALCALGVWLLRAHGATRGEPAQPAASYAFLEAGAPAPPTRPRRAAQPTLAAHDEPPAHPHPITPAQQALREQQQLLAALNDALDLRDAQGLRTLIQRYDALSPEDPQRLGEGYERLADCIEAADGSPRALPGARFDARLASARANAQRYYDDARASSLRRYVRRLCLEPRVPAP